MTAEDIVSQLGRLPAVSPAVMKLIHLLEHPSADNEEVVQAIKHDPILTAKLLRACNSSAFAQREPVGSIDQAILLLGYQEILHRVLALVFGGVLSGALPGYALEAGELWRHSITVALAAELVAQTRPKAHWDPQIAFTAGLLHDIGKLAMNRVLSLEVQTALRESVATGGLSRAEAEQSALGTDHAAVGGHLLELWRLPAEIVEAVAHHHDPVLQPRCLLSGVVHVANFLGRLSGSAPGWEAYAVKPAAGIPELFEFDGGRVETLVIKVQESCQCAAALLKIV